MHLINKDWPDSKTHSTLEHKNIHSRLEYARRNFDETTEFWETVLWTDETKLELFGHMDQRYVWRAKSQAYDQKNTILRLSMEVGH